MAVPAVSLKNLDRHFLGVERSLTGRAWRERLDERGSARALAIAQRYGLDELLARVLAGRNVDVDQVDSFLDPTIKRLMPDPYTLTDMEAAATRIADAITRGELIAIFGDYDVDGATASALLSRYLRHCGLDPIVHIPDRIFEGYGPNVDAIRSFAERGVKLLVTVDCGVTSLEPLAEAKRLGVETVVIDHHQGDEKLPDAVAVVDPNRPDDLSALGHLAAVGLVFLTLVAVARELRRRNFWSDLRPELDLLSHWTSVVATLGGGRAFNFSLRVAREQAWSAAERLHALDDDRQREYVAELDELVSVLAYLITRPPIPVAVFAFFARFLEQHDPKRVTAGLLGMR